MASPAREASRYPKAGDEITAVIRKAILTYHPIRGDELTDKTVPSAAPPRGLGLTRGKWWAYMKRIEADLNAIGYRVDLSQEHAAETYSQPLSRAARIISGAVSSHPLRMTSPRRVGFELNFVSFSDHLEDDVSDALRYVICVVYKYVTEDKFHFGLKPEDFGIDNPDAWGNCLEEVEKIIMEKGYSIDLNYKDAKDTINLNFSQTIDYIKVKMT